jgi:hypothetical protein
LIDQKVSSPVQRLSRMTADSGSFGSRESTKLAMESEAAPKR